MCSCSTTFAISPVNWVPVDSLGEEIGFQFNLKNVSPIIDWFDLLILMAEAFSQWLKIPQKIGISTVVPETNWCESEDSKGHNPKKISQIAEKVQKGGGSSPKSKLSTFQMMTDFD